MCEAALGSMTKKLSVCTPRYLDLSFFSCGGHKIDVPVAPDMTIRLHAFLSANSLVFLSKPEHRVQALLDAEIKELTDGACRLPPPDNTLSARRMSLVFLCRGNTATGGGMELLNAASHLANVPCFSEVPMTRTCRMAYLCGDDAEKYLSERRPALPEASRRVELIPPADGMGTSSVCVTWSIKMGTQTVVHMRIGRLPVVARGKVAEMTDNIISAVSEICAGNGILAPASLCGQRPLPTTETFVEQQVIAHSTFEKLLVPDPVVQLSSYAAKEEKFELDFSEHFVRIVNRSYPITHFSTHTGLLIHEKGRKDEVEAWLKSLRLEEPSRIYGLRPCEGSYEEQLGIHILSAYTEPVSLGTSVSCYGMGGHPGKRLSVRDGCSFFSIKRSISPLDTWVRSDCFVLPCTKASAVPNAVELRLPYFELLENAVISMADVFEGSHCASSVAQHLVKDIPGTYQTPEDRFYGVAWGLGLEVEASTVGSVYEELVRRNAGPDALNMLLLAMISKVGKNTSVADAYTWLKEVVTNSSQRISDLENEIEKLKHRESLMDVDVIPEIAPSKTINEADTPVDHLLLCVNDTVLKKLTNAMALQPGTGSLKMMNTSSDDEIDRLLTLVAKSLNTSKKKFPVDVVTASKKTHANVSREAPITRVLAVAGVITGGMVMTNVFVLSQGDRTSKLFQAMPGQGNRVNIDTMLNATSGTLIHFVEMTSTLYYFCKKE